MKKVVLTDKRYFFIDDSKVEPFKAAIDNKQNVDITDASGQDWYITPFLFLGLEPAGHDAPRPEQKRIEAPKHEYNPDGEGYKKFMAMKEKLLRKWGNK